MRSRSETLRISQALGRTPACMKSVEFQNIPLLSSDGTTAELLKLTLHIVGVEVTSISPSTGAVNGGTPVTIQGCGFTGDTAVTFGGIAATDVVVVSNSSNPRDDSVGNGKNRQRPRHHRMRRLGNKPSENHRPVAAPFTAPSFHKDEAKIRPTR